MAMKRKYDRPEVMIVEVMVESLLATSEQPSDDKKDLDIDYDEIFPGNEFN